MMVLALTRSGPGVLNVFDPPPSVWRLPDDPPLSTRVISDTSFIVRPIFPPERRFILCRYWVPGLEWLAWASSEFRFHGRRGCIVDVYVEEPSYGAIARREEERIRDMYRLPKEFVQRPDRHHP